jgi:hypothetical protein
MTCARGHRPRQRGHAEPLRTPDPALPFLAATADRLERRGPGRQRSVYSGVYAFARRKDDNHSRARPV